MLDGIAVAAPATVDEQRRLRGAAVVSVGTAVPTRVVPNQPIAARLGVSEEWIVTRTGVRERRIAAPGERTVDFAARAAERALASSGLPAAAVDLVLVATMSHDRLTPSAAAVVADRIGAAGAGAIDIGAACSGFVSALVLATAQIEAARADAVLVVGADLLSGLTDPDDRATAALFADGAGAVLVAATSQAGGVGPAILGSDGSRGSLVTASREEAIVRMNGHDTFRQAVERLAGATLDVAAAAGRSLDQIDLFAYHQANSRILAAVGERLGIEPERVIDSIGRHGNTSAATVPLALAEAIEDGRLVAGSTVLLAAFGGGLTWAATIVEWGGGGQR